MGVEISIIIVSWNTKDILRVCLQSIQQQCLKYSYEVIVVDNNSPDGTAEMIATRFEWVKLIANSNNNGFAAANNQGLEVSKGKFLLLLNPDTEIIHHAIDKLIEEALAIQKQNANLGVLTCKLLNPDRTYQASVNQFYSFWSSLWKNRIFSMLSNKEKDYENLPVTTEIDWAFGAVMLFSREVFEKIGYLDEAFYIYAEEIDYFLRVKKAGLKSYFSPQISIIHYGGASSGQKKAEMFIQNYRSFFYLLKKHFGWFSYFAYRMRATLYLSILALIYKCGSGKENKIKHQVYFKTLRWNVGL
jgi:GT2 family glycosyltransferase